MTGPREILFLAHRIPYPPDKGDKIRSFRLFEHLSRRFAVHLGCFIDDPDDFAHVQALKSMAASAAFVPLNPWAAKIRSAAAIATREPLTFAYFADARLRRFVESVRRRALASEFVFSSAMAPYVARAAEAPRLVDLCDADSEKWREYARGAPFPMNHVYAREAETLAAAETRIVNWADAAFAVSDAEASLLGARPGAERRVEVLGNGVDTDYFSPDARLDALPQAFDAIFTGAMDYRANIDAVLSFVAEIWPRVLAARPGATFAIVGARPSPEVMALAGSRGVVVTGRVPDVRPYIAASAIVVAPLRIARGVQNKVLEAMAMGRPVVATAAANAGVKAADGAEIVLADRPDAFAAAMLRLLGDSAERVRIGAAARRKMAAEFGWAARLAALDAALDRLGVA